MNKIVFEWDSAKAAGNIRKHGISFDEASTVFADESAILFDDPDHSDSEDRYLIIGFSKYANMLIVCHCLRGKGDTIRIISARKATRTEILAYVEINSGVMK